MECIDPNFLKRLKKPKDYGDKLPLIINKEMKEMSCGRLLNNITQRPSNKLHDEPTC